MAEYGCTSIIRALGLIYAAVLFIYNTGGARDIKALIIYGIIGLIFFIAGIGLIPTTKDES